MSDCVNLSESRMVDSYMVPYFLVECSGYFARRAGFRGN